MTYTIKFGISKPGWWTLYDWDSFPTYHRKTVQELLMLIPKGAKVEIIPPAK